ncbi:DUF1361 domain-containing protein [Ligilactobacillus ruminis]|uniref:DUF1361 domain-containing protein n=1 Tax=Ligilactobacillus ruminis TaxID=1623 RepID=UPI002362CE8A|nr:DUF1361 domain-containing protein [Ligilactobacillus ruminis]WDC80512.1 DUF1361 domain-containing protein [Ligilactobacillus ruminis]
MSKRFKWVVRTAFFIYIIYAYLTIYRQENFFSFLVLNTFLAYLPVEISFHMNEGQSKIIYWLLFVCWLLFYPNAPYVLTDLFHLARMNPYDAATGLMKFDLHLWLYFTNLVISALACCLMGVWSLEYVTQTIQVRFRKPGLGWRTIIVTVLTIFSSVGVYVGRFLRLHTAYIFLDPGFVIKELITMWSPRMLALVFMMFLLQMTVWVSITIGRITITNLDSKYNLQ